LEKHDATLRNWIREDKGLTLAQLQVRLHQDLGIKLGTTALWHRLEQLGLSYKKNAARRRAKPAGPPGCPPKVAAPAK
jgi:transposase